MTKSKCQDLPTETLTKAGWKSKIKWLLVYLLAIAVILFLLFHRPAYYQPQPVANNKHLSQYLTHYLIPQFYNGVQRQQPFEVVITQQGVNEIARYLPLPEKSGRVNLTSPTISFAPDKIVIAAAADVHGATLIITLEIVPSLNEKGLLNVNIDKVKIGAVNVTIPARFIGRRMYARRFDSDVIEHDNIRTLLTASLFDCRPFNPIFDIDGKKVRLTKIAVTAGTLTLRFEPVTSAAGAAILKY